jgi:hypothetical protein
LTVCGPGPDRHTLHAGYHQSLRKQDNSFTHPIAAVLAPQGILWDPNTLQDPEKLKSILSRGNHPFIIVTQNGLDAGILEGIIANQAIPLKKILP